MDKKRHPATLAATALGWINKETDAMAHPMHLSTSFLRDPDYLDRAQRTFTRDDNPTYLQPEALINQLEGGAGCLLYASGMAAMSAVFHCLKPQDHVILPTLLYSGLRDWVNKYAKHWGLQISYLADYDPASIKRACIAGKTRLVWLETPSNPTWSISDIQGIATVAHQAGALVAIDNTVSTPILTQPIALGADVVLHSGSKYLNGHGDLIAGALVVSADNKHLLQELKAIRNDYGAILGSFEAWLLLRGMRTLPIRIKTISESARRIAEFLESRSEVIEVLYPGLVSHPNHALACRQMAGGFGGMLSFRMKQGEEQAKLFASRVQIIRQAISFGSTETVIEHRAGMESEDSATPKDLLRMSIGLEDLDDLIADLENAFQQIAKR